MENTIEPVKHIVEKEKIIEREVPVEVIKEKIVEVEKIVEIEVPSRVKLEGKLEVIKALCGFNRNMENITKNKNNPFTKSKYLDLSAILEVIRPLLAAEGLSVSQYPINDKHGRIAINTMLIHECGEIVEYPGVFHKPENNTIHALASLETYLRRYQLTNILAIAGKDDDGEGAMGKVETPKPSITPKPSVVPKPNIAPKGRI